MISWSNFYSSNYSSNIIFYGNYTFKFLFCKFYKVLQKINVLNKTVIICCICRHLWQSALTDRHTHFENNKQKGQKSSTVFAPAQWLVWSKTKNNVIQPIILLYPALTNYEIDLPFTCAATAAKNRKWEKWTADILPQSSYCLPIEDLESWTDFLQTKVANLKSDRVNSWLE